MKPFILDLDRGALGDLLSGWGQPSYRVDQIWHGLYQKRYSDLRQFTSLPQALRDKLDEYFEFTHLKPVDSIESSDKETQKTLFSLPDGSKVEAVLMHYRTRFSVCISSQAGCAMGCVFCATGQMGFRRNLTSGEIIEQVLHYSRKLLAQGTNLTNIVIMGMGEPFHNYQATMEAVDRMNHPEGLNLGARRFTISTVGLVPAIRRFANEMRQVNLAISLHAVDDELRSSMLPINKKYPLEELFAACKYYVEKTHRRITFEWALIDGVNDRAEQAKSLADKLSQFIREGSALCHVNLIPLNPTPSFNGKAAKEANAKGFLSILRARGIPCTIRLRRGIDIQAGCGQLADKYRA